MALRIINTGRRCLSTGENAKHVSGLAMIQLRRNLLFSGRTTVEAQPAAVQKKKINRAMETYLERARQHEDFMKVQKLEFQIGTRHLANMMGEDPETFTQDDINNAIEYLFPSALYEKKARPVMQDPEDIFPTRKAAEFDETGRPYHFMFYTMKPNYFNVLYDIVEEINQLNDFEERQLRCGIKESPSDRFCMEHFKFISKEKLEAHTLELLGDKQYIDFTVAMDRLTSLPYSNKCKHFIQKYTAPLVAQTVQLEIPKPKFDEHGRQYITSYDCKRKRARADVTVYMPGTGKISINDRDIAYFSNMQSREQLLAPLFHTGLLNKVDIVANVVNGGVSTQAGAIRLGIATCLRSFVDKDVLETMRLAGLLTTDRRRRERKKPGQEGIRRKYTWKKR